MYLMEVFNLPPCHYTLCKCQSLIVKLALSQPLQKYDSQGASHMQPPAPLWNIDPLFIELAKAW